MKQVKTAFYQLTYKTNKKGEAPVYLRLKHKSKMVNLSTNIYLKPEEWDRKKLRIKSKHPRYYILNKQLKDLEDKVFKIVDTSTSDGATISLESIKLALKDKVKNVATLLSLIDYFLKYIENNPSIVREEYGTTDLSGIRWFVLCHIVILPRILN